MPVTHDTPDTRYAAFAATIGRVTPADYGNIGPPVEHGSNQDCKPGALLLTLARLVWWFAKPRLRCGTDLSSPEGQEGHPASWRRWALVPIGNHLQSHYTAVGRQIQ